MYCTHCGTPVREGANLCHACGKPPSGAPPESRKPRKGLGIILVVILAAVIGFVFVFGLVAAIAIPNLLNAIDRGKQKRTMANIRTVAAAVEGYAVEHNAYPAVDEFSELRVLLEPDHISNCPELDGWGSRLVYEPLAGAEPGYLIRSFGKDGVAESVLRGGPTGDFDCDIVFESGGFTQWPEGMQH